MRQFESQEGKAEEKIDNVVRVEQLFDFSFGLLSELQVLSDRCQIPTHCLCSLFNSEKTISYYKQTEKKKSG